jgi:hypothetical protein
MMPEALTLEQMYGEAPVSGDLGEFPDAKSRQTSDLQQLDEQIARTTVPGSRKILLEERAKLVAGTPPQKVPGFNYGPQDAAAARPTARPLSLDEMYGPQTDNEIVWGGAKAAARAVAAEGTSVGDLLLNISWAAAGSLAEIAAKTWDNFQSGNFGPLQILKYTQPTTERDRERAEASRKLREEVTSKAPTWFTDALQKLSPDEDPDNPSPTSVGKAMEWISEQVDSGGEVLDRRTGGRVTKDDFNSFAFNIMNLLGAKATLKGAGALETKVRNKFFPKKPEPEAPAPIVPNLVTEPEPLQARIDKAAGVTDTAESLANKKARRAQVKGAFADDPQYADYFKNFAEEQDRVRGTAAADRAAEAADKAAPSRVGGAEAVILDETGRPDPRAVGQRPIDTAMDKINSGRGFEMTAEERLALTKNASQWVKKDVAQGFNRPPFGRADIGLLSAVAVGGTAVVLSQMYPDVRDDLGQVALASGLTMMGALEHMVQRPDASSLGTMLESGGTTLKTLERLPQNRSSFPKQMIEEQLKRPDVTKAERDVLGEVLKSTPGDTVSAKDLAVGFKKATGNFELTPEETSEYAPYGLENIDRLEFDPDVHDLMPGETAVREGTAPPSTSTIWQLPEHMPMSDANHFQDPRYFGHTRSFVEDGKRHVVEVQSDLVQNAKGVQLSPEEYTKTLEAAQSAVDQSKLIRELGGNASGRESWTTSAEGFDSLIRRLQKHNPEIKTVLGNDIARQRAANGDAIFRDLGNYDPARLFEATRRSWGVAQTGNPRILPASRMLPDTIRRYRDRMDLHADELNTKLNATAISSQLEPMLKNWDRRLVREELARARKGGDNAARERQVAGYEHSAAEARRYIDEFANDPRPEAVRGLREQTRHRDEMLQEAQRFRNLKENSDVVRFASADTAAKVEGWPEPRANAERRIAANEAVLRDPGGSTPHDLQRTRNLIEHDKGLLAGLGPNRFTPEHQGIYNRYRDLEKFYKTLGGKEVTDSAGHTWYEVSTEPRAQGLSGNRVLTFGAADPKLLAAISAAGGITAYLLANPDEKGALIAAGLIGGAGMMKANPGGDMRRIAALMGPSLYGELKTLPQLSVKEMLQNSFDAVKGQMERDGSQGHIAVGINTKDHSITVADTGAGMKPEVLANQFLQIAGTYKEGGRSSGGFGVAKIPFLYGSDQIVVHTLRDGQLSVLKVTGAELMDALEYPEKSPDIEVVKGVEAQSRFDDAMRNAYKTAGGKAPSTKNGTVVTTKLPREFADSEGNMQPMEMPDSLSRYDSLKRSPLFENIDTQVGFDGVSSNYHEMGSRFPAKDYTTVLTAKFPWGDARVYVTKDRVDIYGKNMDMLSNGLWQFSDKLPKNLADPWSDPVPRRFLINIAPGVEAVHDTYPFDLNRQRFKKRAGDDIQTLKNYLHLLYKKDTLGDEVKTMAEVSYMDASGKRTRVQGLDAVPTEEGLAHSMREGGQVEIRDGILYVEGKQVPLLTGEDMRKAKVEVANYQVPEGTIDTSKPLYHDNQRIPANIEELAKPLTPAEELSGERYRRLDLRDEARKNKGDWINLGDWAENHYGPRFRHMNYEFGRAFIALRDAVSNIYRNDALSPELSGALSKFAVGVGYDNMYRGVNTILPAKVLLVNPSALIRTDPVRGAAAVYGTMLHEMAHTLHRNHGLEFIATQAMLWADLAEHPAATAVRKTLERNFTKYQDILTNLHEVTEYARKERLSEPAGRNLADESDFETRSPVGDRNNPVAGEGRTGPGGAPQNAGGGPATPEQGGLGGRVPPEATGTGRGQAGKTDPEFIARLAALGVPAALGAYLSDNGAEGAIVGMVLSGLGQLAISKVRPLREGAVDILRQTDKTLGMVSTRLNDISKPVARRMLDFEGFALSRGHEALERAHPVVDALNGLTKDNSGRVKATILSGKPDEVNALLASQEGAALRPHWLDLRKQLTEMAAQLKSFDLLPSFRESYFPRVVTDYKGLLGALGLEDRTYLQRILDDAGKKAGFKGAEGLGDTTRSEIINRYLFSNKPGEPRPGFLKNRTVREVTETLAQYYADPAESLVTYLRNGTREIEKAKLFGKSLRVRKQNGAAFIDTESSVGEFVNAEIQAGRLPIERAEEVKSLLNSRFGSGEAGGHWLTQDFKNVTYTGLLANPISALVQLADLPVQIALRGLAPVVEGVVRSFTKNHKYSIKQMGLMDHISEEFAGERLSSRILKGAFKRAGFAMMDTFTKEVAVNAAKAQLERQVKTPVGLARFARRYEEAYGPDYPQLVKDFQEKKLTDLTRSALFSELSRTQPVSRLEVPQRYLDHPNGRTLYMLKSFVLKQLDILRREAYGEIKQGNILRGVKGLLTVGTALAVSGATQQWLTDFLTGRPFDPKLSDIPAGFFQALNLSGIVGEKLQEGKYTEAVGSIVLPPVRMLNDILSGDPRSVRYIPGVGRIIYEHKMGGAEKWKAANLKRKRRQELLDQMTPEEKKEYRRRRKEKADMILQRQAEQYDRSYGATQ